MIGCTACAQESGHAEPHSSTNSSQSKTSSSVESTESNKQIVYDLFNKLYIYEDDGDTAADFAIGEADKLSDKCLGKITSEEDAKEKAEVTWMKIDGYGDAKGEKPYDATYYKEYDVWLIHGALNTPSTDSSGRKYAIPGGVDYIIMRASNGEVLAVWGDS